MPLYKYVVTCDSCDYRSYPWAANVEEAIWNLGVDHKLAKCPKCKTGQLKAMISASTTVPIDQE